MASVALELDWKNFADELDADVRMALVRAVNRTADRTRTRASRKVRAEVNFSATYLSPSEGRLTVTQRARRDDLEAMISGRDRPTSLAQFTKQRPGQKRGQGVAVQVKAGGARKLIKRAFLINLRGGNRGLAVRTSGGPPRGAWKPKMIAKNLYLLYGPSVDQVLMSAGDGGGVYEEITPEALEEMEVEFLRQLELLRNR